MSFDLATAELKCVADLLSRAGPDPYPRPVSIWDIEHTPYELQSCHVSMHDHMADLCPYCGGGNMKVGDYVCWGRCYRCFEEVTGDPE